jgi:alpha-mannosidase
LAQIEALANDLPNYEAFNALSNTYHDVISINGELKPVTAQPFGYACVLDVDGTCSIQATETGGAVLSNGKITAEISRHGTVVSLMSDDIEFFAAERSEGNQLCLYNDMPFFWDAWDVEIYHFSTRQQLNSDTLNTTFEITSTDPHQVSITWTAILTENCKITQTVSVKTASPILEFDT